MSGIRIDEQDDTGSDIFSSALFDECTPLFDHLQDGSVVMLEECG